MVAVVAVLQVLNVHTMYTSKTCCTHAAYHRVYITACHAHSTLSGRQVVDVLLERVHSQLVHNVEPLPAGRSSDMHQGIQGTMCGATQLWVHTA